MNGSLISVRAAGRSREKGAARAVFNLEVIVQVMVRANVQGDSPPGRFDTERLPR